MTDQQTALIEALQEADAWEDATRPIEVIETHISWVFLTGKYAYKIKKAIRLPFVDFSTLERREACCHDELELNRRLAPELYLDVVPIGGTPSEPRPGSGPPIEFAVRMKQFAVDATADRLVRGDALTPAHFTEFAAGIADFHSGLEATTATAASEVILDNLAEVDAALASTTDPDLPALLARVRDEVGRLDTGLRDRTDQGHVRECHGDLHLGNIALIEDRLIAFDCLEFDRALRSIDTIDETAFLWMDLLAHERPDLAFAFLNAWLEASGDFAGLPYLRLYAVHRALVRAKVAAIAQDGETPVRPDQRARAYLGAAAAQLDVSAPRLIITRGLSASGKSTVARQLAPRLGAIHCRSDVERKRLHDMQATDRSGDGIDAGIYSKQASDATYARLADVARTALAARFPVVVDAAFLSAARRRQFRDLARAAGLSFLILDCTAPEAVLRTRLADRRGDASDAGIQVLERQFATVEPISGDEEAVCLTVDTHQGADIAELARRIAARD